jgi:hypothetical protein
VPTCISAVQHLRSLRGGAQAHLLRATDGNCYVTKFQNNPQHVRVLANEMLASRLGRALGLAIPGVVVIEVSEWLIEHTRELRIQLAGTQIPCRCRKQLGSLYVGSPGLTLDYLPQELLLKLTNVADFARILVLDKWSCNADGRQAVFYRRKPRSPRFTAAFVDQGYCFNAGEWTFPDFPLRGVFANNSVYQRVTGWESFEPALSRVEEISCDAIWRCGADIPEEWYDGEESKAHGVNEVRLRKGDIVREGLHTTLSELRLRKNAASPRQRWMSLCGTSSLFIVGRERAKLGYFWRHAYRLPCSGPYMGCVVNADTGRPVIVDSGRLTAADFDNVKLAEIIETRGDKTCRPLHSPLWQADLDKIQRMAPIEFIGRYMPDWFDYAICDEVHQLAGDTAQGNALGTLASCSKKIVGLTGTLLGGFADDLFNTMFRLEAARMKEHGYEWGTTGRSSFTQDYGVLETITKVDPADNRCSKAKTTSVVRRKPGASPLLFGEFLMQLCAFVFLEDISDELPPYEENYISVPMDEDMREAYRRLEDDIREALKKHRGNRSVLSTMLNTLLVYPDHPYGLGTLYGSEFDGDLKRKVRFVIAETRDLPEHHLYSKERRLIQEIKTELAEGRRCVDARYSQSIRISVT